IEACLPEDVAHRAWRDAEPGAGEFAAYPLVAPRRVLTGQAQDRITNVLPGRWPSWTFPRVGPFAGSQVAVPAQQCGGRHEEDAPRPTRQHSRESAASSTLSPSPRSGRFTWRRSTAT